MVVRRRVTQAALTCCILMVAISFGAFASVDFYDASDETLANELMRLLQQKDVEGLEAFLSPAFMIQRADGTYLNKDEYLANHPRIDDYVITDVVGHRLGDLRVIRYNVAAIEAIDGVWVTSDPAIRLSTYVWSGTQWQLFAHANFVPIPSE